MATAFKHNTVWSPVRCGRCEILLASCLEDVPQNPKGINILHPEWHLHTGGGLCVLCRYEERARSQGVNPLSYYEQENYQLLMSVIEDACKMANKVLKQALLDLHWLPETD